MTATTISSWAILIAKALKDYGVDPHPVFIEYGLDPENMRDINARYPYSKLTDLWNDAVHLTNDPCFGLSAAKYWHPTTFHALGFSWMASSTLKEAFERLVRYFRIISTAACVEFAETKEGYQLRGNFPFGLSEPSPVAIDATLAVIVGMCRTSYGDEFVPLCVELKRDMPICGKEYEEYFR